MLLFHGMGGLFRANGEIKFDSPLSFPKLEGGRFMAQ